MIERNTLEMIISDGILAPSGENCQPWRFAIKDNIISVWNVPEADQSVYNYKQRGSLVAHGALLENMSVSAAGRGYGSHIDLFPEASDPDLVARFTVSENGLAPEGGNALVSAIPLRTTNRKKYTGTKLSPEQKTALSHAADTFACRLSFVDDDAVLPKLGFAAALNEKLIFSNKALHDFFYAHLLWDESAQDQKGFYVKTLEFAPVQVPVIRLLKKWERVAFANKYFHIADQILKENGAKYGASGTFLALAIPDDTKESFVRAGMAFERVWLTATSLGLALQPCTGTLFFMQRIMSHDAEMFSADEERSIRDAYTAISSAFNFDGKVIPMLARIGTGAPPTARATRAIPRID